MDLVVFDPGRPYSLYDAVVTHPVSQEVLTTNCVNTRATQQIKERRYRDAASLAGMLLHGLAIEVYGAWGNGFTKMFTVLILFPCLGAVVTNIPKAVLANYWRSVCLQRGVTNAINTRTNRLTARTLDTEEQSEAYRDGSLIAYGEEEDSWGCGTMSAWGEG